MTEPVENGTAGQSGSDDDSVAQRAQAAADPGANHDVGTDGDEESNADRENGE